MNHKNNTFIYSMSIITLLLGGCVNLDSMNTDTKSESNLTLEEKHAKEYYVSVQDYTGEGYKLRNGEKTDKIAEEHRDEIDEAVKKFFLEEYKTEVKVHNVVGAVDGATVFVESVGNLHFFTFAIVPIDKEKKEVLTDNVWSQEGQVENAIMSSIYAGIFEEEFENLDKYIETFTKNNPIVGLRKEAIANVGANGFSTPYYYISIFDENLEILLDRYLENPNITFLEMNELTIIKDIDPNLINITLHLYMKEPNINPSEQLFDQIVLDLENMSGIPPGAYSVYLNDNNIDKKTAIGTKDNTLERSDPNYIIKDNVGDNLDE